MNDLHEWFQKNDLCPENILYLYRNDRKTVVHRMDGEEVALYAPLHSVLSALPEDMFLNISKGIVVCRSQIVDISNDGIYTMSDGRSFQGRRRGLSDHRRLRAEIRRVDAQPRPMSMSLLENAVCWTICRWHSALLSWCSMRTDTGWILFSATAMPKWQRSKACRWKKCLAVRFTKCSPMVIRSGLYRMRMWR